MDFTTKIPIETITAGMNLAEKLTETERNNLGSEAKEGYMADLASRAEWEKRYAEAMRLALQVTKSKTFPWQNCSNVKFPLITVAALTYAARAYPALINGKEVIQGQVFGKDDDGSLTEIAQRVGSHMSWQCLHQDKVWEEETDKLFFVQGVCGCAFRKTWFDPAYNRLRSKLVMPSDLVTNYYTRSLEDSHRYTHRFYLSRNGMEQRIRLGAFLKQELGEPGDPATEMTDADYAQNERQGMEVPAPDSSTPYLIGEQFTWLDLDGDNFAEPYVVTFEINSGKVWRVFPRFLPSGIERYDNKIVAITPVPFFTKYPFIPAPDNGFYDLGLGALLGPINRSVNGAINQLFDAGTMATLGGGFVGRGFGSRGGPFSMRPYMWHPTDAPGDDLRKNVLPLPVKEPSEVLFKLLSFLVSYAERIVSATDIQVGESPGQNMKAGTADILNQNGQRVYTAIYKRTWRSLRDEANVRFENNRLFLTHDVDFTELTTGAGATISPDDYNVSRVHVGPASDPMIVSDQERRGLAMMLMENSMKLPGHNKYQAILRAYKALNVQDINKIMPPPKDQKGQPAEDFPPPVNPKMVEQERKMQEMQFDQKMRENEFHVEQANNSITIKQEILRNQAEITALYAKAQKLIAEASGVEKEHELKLIQTHIDVLTKATDSLLQMSELLDKGMQNADKQSKQPGTTTPQGGGMGGMAAPPADAGVSGGAAPGP